MARRRKPRRPLPRRRGWRDAPDDFWARVEPSLAKDEPSPKGGRPPLDLFVRQRILYLYDFGACSEFDVELLKIKDRPHKGRPKVVERTGGNPKR